MVIVETNVLASCPLGDKLLLGHIVNVLDSPGFIATFHRYVSSAFSSQYGTDGSGSNVTFEFPVLVIVMVCVSGRWFSKLHSTTLPKSKSTGVADIDQIDVTDSLASLDVLEPEAFETMARYKLLFTASVTFISFRTLVIPPLSFVQDSMLVFSSVLLTAVHVYPMSVETSHWKVGAGAPVADTLKKVDSPAITSCLTGWAVMVGDLEGACLQVVLTS